MTAAQLQAGADWVIRKYYGPARLLKRLARWTTIPAGLRNLVYPLGLNLAYSNTTDSGYTQTAQFDLRFV